MTSRPKIAFIVTEDWFFASHFLPMAKAAIKAGLEPVVITRVRRHREAIEASGARVIDLDVERRNLNPFAAAGSIASLAAMLRRENVSIVHCIALRSIVSGGFAAVVAGISSRIFAVTGVGYLSLRKDWNGRLQYRVVRWIVRRILQTRRTHYLFENTDDPKVFWLEAGDENVTVLGGAGIETDRLLVTPMPVRRPIRIAIVSRMLWSKGIDLVVEAVSRIRADGVAVELSLYGDPDPSNPRSITSETLREWDRRPGISWYGFTSDVASVWAEHHVACLFSRGGEGLPRTILEAGASGRPILTSDVPGCQDFVRDGVDGFVVPISDLDLLDRRIREFASMERAALETMGRRAHERVKSGYTTAMIENRLEPIYARMNSK